MREQQSKRSDRRRCAGFRVSSGKPCRAWEINGTGFCAHHQPNIEKATSKTKRKVSSLWTSKEAFALYAILALIVAAAQLGPAALVEYRDWRRAKSPELYIDFDINLSPTNATPARFVARNASKHDILDLDIKHDIKVGDFSNGLRIRGGNNNLSDTPRIAKVPSGKAESFIVGGGALVVEDVGKELHRLMKVKAAFTYREKRYTNEFGFQMVRDSEGKMRWAPRSE